MASDTGIDWQAPDAAHLARDASRRSMGAVARKDKDAWLDLFADDGFVEDPVGPSPFDPEARGHHGRAAISAFWDLTIANTDHITFVIRESYAAGDEVANVGTITSHFPGGAAVDAHGVFSYKVDAEGRIRWLRAYWEFERVMASLQPS